MLHTHAVRTGSTVGPAGLESGAGPLIHLRSGGVSLLLQVSSPACPWFGTGAPTSAAGRSRAVASLTALLPREATPYAIIRAGGGERSPALTGTHEGQTTGPTFTEVQHGWSAGPSCSRV